MPFSDWTGIGQAPVKSSWKDSIYLQREQLGNRATIWRVDDPFRYRILDQEALSDPDICLVSPPRPAPPDAR